MDGGGGGGELSHGKGKREKGKEKGAIEHEPVKKRTHVLKLSRHLQPFHFCRLYVVTQGANDCGKKRT